MSDRMTTLSVFTQESDEEGMAVFKILSDIGAELALTHQSATVSTHKMEDSLDGDDVPEDLYYDEKTMFKVHTALREAVKSMDYSAGTVESFVDGLIHSMQNYGILFREKRK